MKGPEPSECRPGESQLTISRQRTADRCDILRLDDRRPEGTGSRPYGSHRPCNIPPRHRVIQATPARSWPTALSRGACFVFPPATPILQASAMAGPFTPCPAGSQLPHPIHPESFGCPVFSCFSIPVIGRVMGDTAVDRPYLVRSIPPSPPRPAWSRGTVQRPRSDGASHQGRSCRPNCMKGDRERCLKAGMDGYVLKPLRHK